MNISFREEPVDFGSKYYNRRVEKKHNLNTKSTEFTQRSTEIPINRDTFKENNFILKYLNATTQRFCSDRREDLVFNKKLMGEKIAKQSPRPQKASVA